LILEEIYNSDAFYTVHLENRNVVVEKKDSFFLVRKVSLHSWSGFWYRPSRWSGMSYYHLALCTLPATVGMICTCGSVSFC